MVASTITLHLVQCRAVGRNQASQSFKSSLTLNSSGAGFLKRQLPMQMMSNSKKLKLSKESKTSSSSAKAELDGLALDPRNYEHKTYEARKNFLTAYFNRRPYLTPQEEEKLSASLWLWKSDICSHFATKQMVCKRECESTNMSVLLGFDMQALKKIKHDIVFQEPDGTSVARPGGLKSGTPSTEQNKRRPSQNSNLTVSSYTEPISIDSDSEGEDAPAENGNELAVSQQEKAESAESKELIDLTENTQHGDADDPSMEDRAVQDEKTNAVMTLC